MAPGSKLLVMYGFFNGKGKEVFGSLKTPEQRLKKLKQMAKGQDLDDFAEQFADHHLIELRHNQMMKTAYPVPTTKQDYILIYETFQRPIESYYFWCLNQLEDLGYPELIKVTDVFAASEHSAMYGVGQQRLGMAQQKVAEYLISVGKLVRELFQIVRELRILDERMEYYEGVQSKDEKVRVASEVALKAIFVEFVEGGAKNINSVYGLARELRYSSLPDLFFSLHPKSTEVVHDAVKRLEKEGFNQNVLTVLEKKWVQYLTWRTHTSREIGHRRKHTLKYLRQHYSTIQLYLTWIKPYLRHIRRLSEDQKKLDTPDLVAAFEGSVIEIEVMAVQIPQDNKEYYQVIVQNFMYRTSPEMAYHQDYQRGALHRGKLEMTWRSYAWTRDQINAYKKMRDAEGFEMLANVDSSIKDAMTELGESLHKYLEEAGEEFEKEPELKEEKKYEFSWLGPFKGVVYGFGDLFKPLVPSYKGIKSAFKLQSTAEKETAAKKAKEFENANRGAEVTCWLHYRNFKKAHRLVTW